MALGVFAPLSAEFERAHVLTQNHQLVMGRSHAWSQRQISAADLPELDFLMIGHFPDVENMMGELGLTGRIRQRIGHYLAAPLLLADGSLVAWLPRSLVKPLALFGDYLAFDLPQAQQVFSVSAVRLRRSERDPGLKWFWQTVLTVLDDDTRSLGTNLKAD